MDYTTMGWMFVFMAAFFALGLLPQLAKRFYPDSARFRLRLAAPIIFGLMATACFIGLALPAMVLTVALGLPLVVQRKRRI